MSTYLGVPQFERVAEPVSEPLDPELEAAHYAEFLWGKNSPDLSQPQRWWFDTNVDPLCVTDGNRYFIPSTDPEFAGYVQEVLVIKNGEGQVEEISGLTHPTSYRHLSPLNPGETATTRTPDVQIQHFWD